MKRRDLLTFAGMAAFAPLAWAESGLRGTVRIVGSDSLSTALAVWSQAYRLRERRVDMEIQSSGSASGAIALIQGTADLSPMSRSLTVAEVREFVARYGYRPSAVEVALDALTIITAPANALEKITLIELDQIYGDTRRCSFLPRIERFEQLHDGRGNPQRIIPVGRTASSGSYGYFRTSVLCSGRFAAHYRALPGAASVAFAVARSPAAMGYVGLGFLGAQVKALRVARSAGELAYAPTEENVLSRRYPLSRKLKVYFNRAPAQALKPAVQDFLQFALSEPGQRIARRCGLIPLPAAVLGEMRAKIVA